MDNANLPDDGFDAWLAEGQIKGYCSEQYCATHGMGPFHESEWMALEEGFDPCNHVVRLGNSEDWDVTPLLEGN